MGEKVYTYYPGCSVKATAAAYAQSIDAVAQALGLRLLELEDWNCCGATAYMSVRELLSFVISARNLVLAEPFQRDVVTPCSACFTTLRKTVAYLEEFPELREKVNAALAEVGMEYKGGVNVRHLFSVLVDDVGIDVIKEKVTLPLENLKVACYYGCQLVRPKYGVDDTDMPEKMDNLIAALGATPVYYPMKTKCCGASLIGSNQAAALQLIRNLLLCAKRYEADCIITPCPLCQFNLDVYQNRVNGMFNTDFNIPVFYVTQLVGLALGANEKQLGLEKGLVGQRDVLAKYQLVR
jgi:heterodisulfide reductase subunit B